ncbi:hypothetical protein [Micromonospora sp. WMMD737]
MSDEDPDAALSDVVAHLTGPQHHHPLDVAMKLLTTVEEAPEGGSIERS